MQMVCISSQFHKLLALLKRNFLFGMSHITWQVSHKSHRDIRKYYVTTWIQFTKKFQLIIQPLNSSTSNRISQVLNTLKTWLISFIITSHNKQPLPLNNTLAKARILNIHKSDVVCTFQKSQIKTPLRKATNITKTAQWFRAAIITH